MLYTMPSKKSRANKKAKASSKQQTPVQESAPVETVQEVAPVETTPVESAPVETAPVQKGAGKKSSKSKAKKAKSTKASKAAPVEAPVESVQETEATETVATETQQTAGGKRVRSFKVMLPGGENYEGRFTGLTPYQAANKALSKYYRETNKPKKEIRFSIRESTRGSKRNVYTYNGRREKLSTPVEYSIKDGRTIVKKFKNRLVKVKKAELDTVEV